MINYSLQCSNGHRFDGWFASSGGFETQAKRGLVACPTCGDTAVTRALMAPAVQTSRKKAVPKPPVAEPSTSDHGKGEAALLPPERPGVPESEDAQKLRQLVKTLRDAVREKGTDVGKAFPEEARKIHYGEAEERGIYGQASLDEAKSLLEEGIEILPLPSLPEEQN